MVTSVEATLTDFLRDPNAIVEKLEQDDVVLHRRNADDLRLSLQSRCEAGDEGLRVISQLLGLAMADDIVRDRLAAAAATIPWVSLLPRGDREIFVRDLVRTGEAAGELGSMVPIGTLVAAWKATAATHANAAPSIAKGRPTGSFARRSLTPPGA